MDSTGLLGAGDLEVLRKDFAASPAYRLAQNAVTRVTVDDVAINREIVNGTEHSLSVLLDDWKVTNQERSGRCWLFAGLNLLRVGAMHKMGLKEFEFSPELRDVLGQARARQLLPRGDHRDRGPRRSTTARSPSCCESAAGDGGQWNMFVALVGKHGLVPKSVHAGDAELVEHGPDERDPALASCAQGARAVRAAYAPGGARRRPRAEKAEILRGRLPDPVHPPRHAAGAVRLAVDRQGQGVPPGRRAHAAGVRRQVRRPAGRRLRLPGATTRGRPARTGGPSPSSTSATSIGGAAGDLPQRRHAAA